MNLLDKIERILTGHVVVSEETAVDLFEAYKKLYEAKGEYYRDEELNLRFHSADELLHIYAREIRKLANEFDEIRMKNQFLQNKSERAKKKQEDLRDEIEELKSECKHLSEQITALHSQIKEEQEENKKRFVELVQAFISFRDNLYIIGETAKEQQDDNVNKVIAGLIQTSKSTFLNNGVEVLDEKGMFNPEIQKIVEVIPTDNISQENQIAETFRCGYKLNNSLIRLQEVKVYSYNDATE